MPYPMALTLTFALATSTEAASTEQILAEEREDCLQSMVALGYSERRAMNICECYMEQLETLLDEPLSDTPLPDLANRCI